MLGLGASAGSAATTRPCVRHTKETAVTKRQCVRQYKRSKQRWPKNPKAWEIRRRVGLYNWNKASRVAICETGKKVRWYLGPNGEIRGRYVSALGMYVSTFEYGRRKTGYRGRNWQEQVAIAVAAHDITGNWNGWGCRGA